MKTEEEKIVEKAFKKVSAKVIQYIYKINLLEADDHIMVGLSGGKDSYLLLEVLAECIRRLPYPIKVSAAHVYLSNVGYKIDTVYMSALCQKLGIPFYLLTDVVDEEKDRGKGQCFICSWMRRKMIFQKAKQLGCNKIALGHHMDDAVQTMLMNQIWHGTLCSMPSALSMLDDEVTLIRPLLVLEEHEVTDYTNVRCYPKAIEVCPHDCDTKRAEVRAIMQQIKRLNKAALKNMFRSMENIYPEYLPQSGKPFKRRNTENLLQTSKKE